MATKAKKGGKKKGQTLNLNEFLGGEGGGSYRPPGAGATTTVEVGSTWAEEMDDEGFDADRPKQQIVLPTAPRAALGPDIDDDRIPKRPPYTAYIANLPYDVDEGQVEEVFVKARLKIKEVRLMKDEGGRLRGYGYADFEDRDSLVDVLTMSDLAVNNRKIRIDLASQAGKDKGGGGFGDRQGGGEDRPGRREEDPNAGRSDADTEWRRGPAPAPRDDDRGGGGERNRYGGRDSYDRDRGGDRGGDKGGSRGFGNYEPPRERGGFERGGDRDRDGGGSRYGGFSRDRDAGGARDGGGDRDREREAPKERPKLSLAPRSKPAEENSSAGSQSSSIFGGAKPVDTLAKEKAIEEKLGKDVQEEPRKSKPSSNPFGGAKPVDTSNREKEIEEKMSKLDVKPAERVDVKPPVENAWRRKLDDDDQSKPSAGSYRPPGRREDGDRRDDRGGYNRDRRDDKGGYDRDRRDDRGGSDRDRRDDRGGSDRDRGGSDRDRGGSDRDRGGSDRDRQDDRGSDRGYDRGGSDRGGPDRSSDKDRRDDGDRKSDRDDRDDKANDRRDEPRENDRPRYDGRDSREKSSEVIEKEHPPMKKFEENTAPVVVAANKFAFLQEEDVAGSGGED